MLHALGMWRAAVKATLLDERTRWLEQHRGQDVAILSVTQLVDLLQDGISRRTELESRGIQCHDISPELQHKHHRSLKRPRTEMHPTVVSFASTKVWITGFVRYEDNPRTPFTLCLCDAMHTIAAHIVYPALTLLDGLVLIKSWTIVQHHPQGRLVMEVHGDPMLLYHPQSPSHLSLDDAIATLETQYTTSDPPMYTGWSTWESVTNSYQTETTTTTKKKRKVYAVLGRIHSLSPISVQEDVSSSHFFVEVERMDPSLGSRAIVNILLAGAISLKWHLFLWPGLLVLWTNLKKVYYAESELFLLQTSDGDSSGEGRSSLFVWKLSMEVFRPLPDTYTAGATIDVEGIVTSIVWDECLMLDSHVPVLVALFQYPWSEMKDYLRIGSRIHVYQAHVLHHSSVGPKRLCVGLCSRSHLRIVAHASPTSPASMHRYIDPCRRSHKKWALFGDFSRQSLVVTMWWLNLLEVLVQKFRFHTKSTNQRDGCHAVIICTRRREATLALGQDIFSATPQASTANGTLARRFLNAHNEDGCDCPSVMDSDVSLSFSSTRVLTLRNIEAHVRRLARDNMAATNEAHISWPIWIEEEELSGLCAVGALRGCVSTCDLEIKDETASIPVILDCGGNTNVGIDKGCAVYAFRKYGAVIEYRSTQTGQKQEIEDHELVVSLTVSIGNVQRVSFCSNGHHGRGDGVIASNRCDILVFVTQIGPWKRRRRMQTIVHEYRTVRGVGFRLDNHNPSQLDCNSMNYVELLVDTESESWFLLPHQWYKYEGIRVNSLSRTELRDAHLVHHWTKIRANHENGASTEQSTSEMQDQTDRPGGKCDSISYVVDANVLITALGLSTTTRSLVETENTIGMDEQTRRCVTSMEELAIQSKHVTRIRDLFVIDNVAEEMNVDGGSLSTRADPHAAKLIDLVGVVKERHLYYKHVSTTAQAHHSQSVSSRSQMCRLKLRDTQTLETVFVTIDEGTFGTMSTLQPGALVEILRVQCFIARASYKPFLTWTHGTTARRLETPSLDIVSDSRLFTQMPTTYLYALYKTNTIDRTIKRFVVQFTHLSYAVLKRRCRQCKQPLSLIKRQQVWIHTTMLNDESNDVRCTWKQIAYDSPVFSQHTVLSCSVRGIIDDGSAQAELFLENDMVWELFHCTPTQRHRFEQWLVWHTSELCYFATRSTTESVLFTTPSMQETAYYQNEWRAFIHTIMTSRGSFVVFAQRFYKPLSINAIPPTAVLTFGKDIQITTPSVPLLPLEARRIDALDARQELRRRLTNGTRL